MARGLVKKVLGLSLVTGVGGLLAQACMATPANAQSADTIAPLVGAWSSQVTLTDCHGAGIAQFAARNLFHHGGTVTDTDVQPPTAHGPALGTWKSLGGTAYSSVFHLDRYAPDGSFVGSNRVARQLTLSADGNAFTATIDVSVIDPGGTQVATVCGTESAARLQ